MCQRQRILKTVVLLQLLLFSALWVHAGADATAGSPKLQVGATVYDLGTIKEPTDIQEIDVSIFNGGAELLRMALKASTCECTEVTSYDKEITPDQMGLIHVKIDPLSGSSGRNVQLIRFTTNDPGLPLLEIEFIYTLAAKDVEFSPHLLDFHISKQRLLEERNVQIGTIYIKDMWEQRLELEDIKFSSSNFAYTSYDTVYTCLSGKKTHKIMLHFFMGSEMPVGAVDESVMLLTNHEGYPQIKIPIKGLIRPRIKLSPKVVFLRDLLPGQVVKREIEVKSLAGELQLGNVQVEHPWFKVTKTTVTGAHAIITLEGKVPERPESTTERARIQVEIKKPDRCSESIEVLAYARS